MTSLIETENLFRAFDLAPLGLCVSEQRVIQKCNRSFASMFGFRPADLSGRCLSLLYPSENEYKHIGERALTVMRLTYYASKERRMVLVPRQWDHDGSARAISLGRLGVRRHIRKASRNGFPDGARAGSFSASAYGKDKQTNCQDT